MWVTEFNIYVDPAAADIVCSRGIAIIMGGLAGQHSVGMMGVGPDGLAGRPAHAHLLLELDRAGLMRLVQRPQLFH